MNELYIYISRLMSLWHPNNEFMLGNTRNSHVENDTLMKEIMLKSLKALIFNKNL